MYKQFSHISKSEYIQQLISQSVSKTFSDPAELKDIIQDIESDISQVEEQMQDSSSPQEQHIEEFKKIATDMMAKIMQKIIHDAYSKFIADHAQNVVQVCIKSVPGRELESFLFSLKSSHNDGVLNSKSLLLLEEIKQTMLSRMEVHKLINNSSFNLNPAGTEKKAAVINANLILMEDSNAVCFHLIKEEKTEAAKLVYKIAMSPEVLLLITHFHRSNSEHSREDDNEQLLQTQKNYVYSIYNNLLSKKEIFGEKTIDSFNQMHALQLVKFEIDGLEVSPQEMFDKLKEKQFNPTDAIKNLFKR